MRELPSTVQMLLDIEARQDDVLRQLEELDERIARVLAECGAFCKSTQLLPAIGVSAEPPAMPPLSLPAPLLPAPLLPAPAAGSVAAIQVA